MSDDRSIPRIGAVSFLNTVPLIWGMLHGSQRTEVDLSFSIPSVCADRLAEGVIDVGLAPVAEIARQELQIVSRVGITCRGPVRSILLFARVPWREVRALAADISSRTSVELARIILRERFGVEPAITPQEPVLGSMLATSDSALIIGDPALRLDPQALPYEYLDLGQEWFLLTGLPMVFAAWAAKPGFECKDLDRITWSSYQLGKKRIGDIVEQESAARGISRELAERYLTHHIRFELGNDEQRGLEAFLDLADLRRTAAQGVL